MSLTHCHVRVSFCVVLYDTNECSILHSCFACCADESCVTATMGQLSRGQVFTALHHLRLVRCRSQTTLAGCSSTWALGSLRPPSRNAMWTSLVLRVLGEPSESLLDTGSLPALRLQPGIRPCSPFVPARRAVLLRDHPDLASSTVRLRAPSANWIS